MKMLPNPTASSKNPVYVSRQGGAVYLTNLHQHWKLFCKTSFEEKKKEVKQIIPISKIHIIYLYLPYGTVTSWTILSRCAKMKKR